MKSMFINYVKSIAFMGNQVDCSCPCAKEDRKKEVVFDSSLIPNPSALSIATPLSIQPLQLSSNCHTSQELATSHKKSASIQQQESPLRLSGLSSLSGSGCRSISDWPRQILLTVDEKWPFQLRNSSSDPIEIKEVYQLTKPEGTNEEDFILCERVKLNNRKIQLLFKQHIPSIGKHFFEFELLRYDPKNKCQFTVGIVDYQQACKKVHCRDRCIEQSITYQTKRPDQSLTSQSAPILVGKKIKMEVSREREGYVAFYIDGQLMRKQEMSQQLINKGWVMPFIQTQFTGISFQWKTIRGSSGWNQPFQSYHSTFRKTLSVIEQSNSTSNP